MGNAIYKKEGRLSTTISVFEDRVIIERGIMGRMTTGGPSEKTLFYANLTGVEYKKPGLLSGYINFNGPGLQMSSGTINSQKNENSIVFATQGAEWKEIADYINSRIAHSQNKGTTIIQNQSSADELLKFKKLLDEGIITQDEFEQQKKKLLNL